MYTKTEKYGLATKVEKAEKISVHQNNKFLKKNLIHSRSYHHLLV
jgi:hypothetical protein